MRPVTAVLLLAVAAWAQDHRPLEREIFRELVEINTAESAATQSGTITRAAQAMAARLRAAGFPAADVQVVGADANRLNLVARLRGSGAARPVLFNAHLDVVEALRQDWSFDPFTFLEKDGFFYGRGTQDDKAGAAGMVAAFIRLKQENYRPRRDLILALTAGEESGVANGVGWLVKNRRDLIDSEFSINVDSGGGDLRDGKPRTLLVETSEKTYHTLFLEVKNKGGHSSLPVPDNAINRLAAALTRVAQFEFPVRLSETTRAYFDRMSRLESGQTAADLKAVVAGATIGDSVRRLTQSSWYNAQLRTTCIATQLSAGHAENALPQTARATVNCRVLPVDDPLEVERTIRRVVADPEVSVKPARQPSPSPASPLRPDVWAVLERAAAAIWPGVPVIPVMETGGTDGRILRGAGIPTYGETGMFIDEGDTRAHGQDERIRAEWFYQGCEFLYRLAKEL